jgi:hypothetical protein
MNTNSGSFGSLASATPLRLIVLVAICLAVAGCGDVGASGGAYRVGGPDEYGVVCYQSRSDTFSCVKVR